MSSHPPPLAGASRQVESVFQTEVHMQLHAMGVDRVRTLGSFLMMAVSAAVAMGQTCVSPCAPWTVQSFGCDAGRDNVYRLERDGTPICGSRNCPGGPGSCWGASQVGVTILDSRGSIRMDQGNDYQVYGHTYLFAQRPITLRANLSADVGRVWLNNQEVTAASLALSLSPGNNHLEFTSYNQHQSTSLTIGFTGDATGVVIGPTPHCRADLDNGSGQGVPDGGVTNEDLLFFLAMFGAGDIRADLDDGSSTGTPDGGLTIDDLLFFLEHFVAGC